MEKLKELYKKYVNWIVIILLLLFVFKSCQSSRYSRQIDFYQQTTQVVLDSIHSEVVIRDHSIDSLNNELKIKQTQIQSLQNENRLLRESNGHYRQTNKKLIENINKE